MINPEVIVRLAEQNEVHTEGGVVHDIDRLAGQDAELRENYFAGDDWWVITTGVEGYGSMASYEVPAEHVETVRRLTDEDGL